MDNVIYVNFKEKRKIKMAVITNWACVVCNNLFEHDSSREYNVQRIVLREGNTHRNQECICQKCARNIKDLVEEHKW